MVEDNSTDAYIVQQMLRKTVSSHRFEWLHVVLIQQALKRLGEENYDIILLDLSLPDGSGLDTVIQIRNKAPHTPIVVMSGYDDESVAVQAVQEGAQDYLVKGQVDGQSIIRSIRYAIERKRTEEELKKHRDHLEELVEERTAELLSANVELQQEISERQKIDESLRKSEERYRLLLESISDGVFVLDQNYKLVMVNDGVEHFMQLPKEKLLGSNLTEIIPKMNGPKFLEKLQIVMKTGKPGTVSSEFLYAGAKHGWCEFHVYPVPEGILCIATDITERKQVELEKYRISTELEQSTLQLRKTNIELKKANYAKSEFLAKMSHELRTPLNVILANAQMLEQSFFGDLSEIQKTKMTEILNHGESLLLLINDILDHSKITAGEMVLELRWINLTELLQSYIQDFSGLTENKEVQIYQHLEENVEIYGDSLRIKQIISNLISNAIKFTPKGRIDISLQLLSVSKVQIDVEDTGIGIAKRNLTKVFQDFYQISSQTLGSTGLGLAIAKKLVKKHKGEIFLESELGQGSKFTVILPIGSPEKKNSLDKKEVLIKK